VMGVTTLNDKIFIVYHELPFIVVYMSQQPYTRLPNISINGLKCLNTLLPAAAVYMSVIRAVRPSGERKQLIAK